MFTRNAVVCGLAAAMLMVPGQAMARTQIRVVGSSTVYPFTTAVAERFGRANPKLGTPIIESTGTGAGMKLFCAGIGEQFPDIENASRRIKASEAKLCAQNGVTQITEIQIGMDGLALATAKNSPLTAMTLRAFYTAMAKTPFGKPQKAKTWKDVNAKLPAIPIRVYGPPPTSGTRDSFNELLLTAGCESAPAMVALKKANEAKFKAIRTSVREDGAFVEAGENDNLIVQKIEANSGTVGAFGYSYLEENMSLLKGIALNGVEPNYGTISTFKYPGARAMFVYVKNAHVRAIPAIRGFVAEYAKETTWGPKGYLISRGLIASHDDIRAKSAAAARTLTPLDFKTVK